MRLNLNSADLARSMNVEKSLTLAQARCGERLRITAICPNCPECVRLREIGFRESSEICKMSDGGAMICLLMGNRVALGRKLGSHIHVERIAR